MAAATATAAPPEAREPAVDWALLRKLAAGRVVSTGVEAPPEGKQDPKPLSYDLRKCRACGVKYPGGQVCGYSRGRIAELRTAAAGEAS